MSTLKANNLANNSGGPSRSMDDIVGATPRAWVNFNGTGTVAIRAAYNVSSITDNGTGDYTVNFTNAMPDTNYAAVGGAGHGSSSTGLVTPQYTQAPTALAIRILTTIAGGSVADFNYVNLAAFR